MELIQLERLKQLDEKWYQDPQSLTDAEGVEYVKLLATARQTVSKTVREPKASKKVEVKISAADFIAKLKARQAQTP